MNNSYMLVFSFLINAIKIIESEQEDFEEIFKVRYHHYHNAKQYSKIIIKRIYNELENHFYTYKDLFIFMLYKYAFNEKIKIYNFNFNDIKNVAKIFTKKQIKKDEEFIIKINETLKLKSVDEFFQLRENGEPIIYELIKNNFITPAVYVKYFEKILTIENKDVILMSDNYKKFRYAMKNIIKIIKGGLDE
jgi:hypothetical protein